VCSAAPEWATEHTAQDASVRTGRPPLTGRAPSTLDRLRSEIPIATVHTAIGRTEVRAGPALSILHRPTHTIVRLRGDIATVPAGCERLPDMVRAGMKLLTLDLARVSFCDVAEPAVCSQYTDRVLRPWRDRA
jgi:hypothetical protein